MEDRKGNEKEKAKDISSNKLLANIPEGKGYERTTELVWYYTAIDGKPTLAQKCVSALPEIPDVWVALPHIISG